MTDEEKTQIETWDEWEDTGKELIDLKKEMAKRIVDKMWEQNNDLFFLFWTWKKLIADYLVDEWREDVINNDLWAELAIDFFSWNKDQLKNIREDIKKVESKEALADLEARIIKNLENGNSTETQWDIVWWESTQGKITTAWAAVASASATTISSSKENYNSNIKVSVDSAKVWDLASVPKTKEARMNRLFPLWTPERKKDMEKYLTKIEIPVRTQDLKEDRLTLKIHAKLTEEIKAIFKEMYDKNIPVNPKKTWAFCWRKVRGWNSRSQHSYWCAIDVNYNVNGWDYWKTDESSPYFNGKETVAIWKKHGFFRWWDWKTKKDPMHFWIYDG